MSWKNRPATIVREGRSADGQMKSVGGLQRVQAQRTIACCLPACLLVGWMVGLANRPIDHREDGGQTEEERAVAAVVVVTRGGAIFRNGSH